jgi:transcription termination/antitermination protein NusA
MSSLGTIYQSIEILSKEKGIEPKIILDAVKDAMLVAARKHFHTTEDLVAEIDERTGAIQIFGVRKVVPKWWIRIRKFRSTPRARSIPSRVDTEIRIPKPTEALGRISAQTAKQVICKRSARPSARIFTRILGPRGRAGDLRGQAGGRPGLVADLGKTEARLPKKEQSKLESFSVGDRIRCVIKSVEKAGKNAGVMVSRAAPELVMRLFEQEVPGDL